MLKSRDAVSFGRGCGWTRLWWMGADMAGTPKRLERELVTCAGTRWNRHAGRSLDAWMNESKDGARSTAESYAEKMDSKCLPQDEIWVLGGCTDVMRDHMLGS